MSCLFNSLSRYTGEPAQQIRLKICEYLATDPLLYEDLSASLAVKIETGKDLAAYIQQMRSPSTWGGAIEIRAFVKLWNRPVKVWAIRTKRWIEFANEGAITLAECKISWNGGHYEPII